MQFCLPRRSRRETDLLVRLTDPAKHRALRIWLAHATGLPKPPEEVRIRARSESRTNRPTAGRTGPGHRRFERPDRGERRKVGGGRAAMGSAKRRLVLSTGAIADRESAGGQPPVRALRQAATATLTRAQARRPRDQQARHTHHRQVIAKRKTDGTELRRTTSGIKNKRQAIHSQQRNILCVRAAR